MKAILLLILIASFTSCLNNAEIGSAKDVDPQSIYYDYSVTGEEGKEEVTVMLQYRFGGKAGTTLVLEEPSKVLLDSTKIKVDSAKFSGAFYEVSKPAEAFKGMHTILFRDRDKKTHAEQFEYQPFHLTAELPDKIKKQPFTIKLSDFSTAPTLVRLVMTDTAFASRDVNEKVLVTNGELKIDSIQLSNLTTGPVSFEIYREEERPVKNGSREGGRIQITYGLKREFTLVD